MAQQPPPHPKPLMALCHDALAEGVLAKHDGQLPESWIEMFKAHPAAWEQLTDAVTAAPWKREEDRPFGPDATVHISMTYFAAAAMDEADRLASDDDVVRADELPTWFFHLLHAWLRANRLCPVSDGSPSSCHVHVGASGGIELAFSCPRDVSQLYRLIRDLADTKGGEFETICHELTVQLYEDMWLDPTYELWNDIHHNNRRLEKAGQRPLDTSAMSTSDLLKHFSAVGRDRARISIESWIIQTGDLWEEGMRRTLKCRSLGPETLQQHVPCPAFALHFYYCDNNVYWEGEQSDIRH